MTDRVLTNNTALAYAIEQSLGVLPGSPEWKTTEPNEISTFGVEITKVAREPISKNRQRRKGTVTDLDSAVEFAADLTLDSFRDFIEGFVFANFTGAEVRNPTSIASDAFIVPAFSAAPVIRTLVYSRNFTNSANNGLHEVDTGATTTNVPVTSTLVDETPAAAKNAKLEIAGYRSTAGDLDVDANGNITSTVLDFTTLPIQVGQMIHIGGAAAINRFTNAANVGYARVTAIATNLLTIDKKSQTFVTEANTTQEVDLYYGQFLKNVPVDDANYLERSFTFEAAYDFSPDPDEYEYPEGS